MWSAHVLLKTPGCNLMPQFNHLNISVEITCHISGCRIGSGCGLLFLHYVRPASGRLSFRSISASPHTSWQSVISAFEFLSPLIFVGFMLGWSVTVKTNRASTSGEAADRSQWAWAKATIRSLKHVYNSLLPESISRAIGSLLSCLSFA